MAQNDIKKKFLIEYDKANVTSSYPSLTPEEIATILNKAYLALIAQKTTGNNPRRAPFEADTKAISDIQQLVITQAITQDSNNDPTAENSRRYILPSGFLYYVQGTVELDNVNSPVDLISHENAKQFKQSRSNRPWIKNAVGYIEDNKIVVLYDNYYQTTVGDFNLTYVKMPTLFTASFEDTFELNDSMAEELISLAVTFALENVESTRLQTKAQMRGLEA